MGAVDLNGLIVCAVCHSDLPLEAIRRNDVGLCPSCGQRYTCTDGVLDMTPHSLSDEVLKSRWSLWEKLQANGLISYTQAPEFNLTVAPREDGRAFREFCHFSGLILDVGCGPQRSPSHLPEGGHVVGLDPLIGEQPREFAFVRGIGEYLPFRSGSFDHIVFVGSLDHMLDPRRALREAERCLKPNGSINLKIGADDTDSTSGGISRWGQYLTLAQKGLKTLTRPGWISMLGWRRTLSYLYTMARMKVPEGATDYFHFEHLSATTIESWLSESNFAILRKEPFAPSDMLFIQAKKR